MYIRIQHNYVNVIVNDYQTNNIYIVSIFVEINDPIIKWWLVCIIISTAIRTAISDGKYMNENGSLNKLVNIFDILLYIFYIYFYVSQLSSTIYICYTILSIPGLLALQSIIYILLAFMKLMCHIFKVHLNTCMNEVKRSY